MHVEDNHYEVLQLPGHSNYRINKRIPLPLRFFPVLVILITCSVFVTLISDLPDQQDVVDFIVLILL